jgi:hypothetical protein
MELNIISHAPYKEHRYSTPSTLFARTYVFMCVYIDMVRRYNATAAQS